MTLDGESWDNACCWAFKRTYARKPSAAALADYQLALAERAFRRRSARGALAGAALASPHSRW
jgi:hypothetical protein